MASLVVCPVSVGTVIVVEAGAKKSRMAPPNHTAVPTKVASATAKNQSRSNHQPRRRTVLVRAASLVTLRERFELREVELRIRIHPHDVFVFFQCVEQIHHRA